MAETKTKRTRAKPETEAWVRSYYELMDTGVFDHGRYWSVDVAYAKASPTEVLAKITIKNHAAEAAPLLEAPPPLGGLPSELGPPKCLRFAGRCGRSGRSGEGLAAAPRPRPSTAPKGACRPRRRRPGRARAFPSRAGNRARRRQHLPSSNAYLEAHSNPPSLQ